MSKACVVAVMTSATIGLSITAAASPIRVDTTGDACDMTELAAQVDKLVHADGSTMAKVEVVTRDDGVEASVQFVDDDGTVRGPRVIRAAECKRLVESVAIVIAMGLHEDPAPAPRIDPPVEPDVPREPPRVVREAALEMTAVAAPPRSTNALAVVVAAGGGVSANGAAAELIAGLRWRRGDRSIGAEVRTDSPDHESVGFGQVDVRRVQMAIAPCLHRGPMAMCGVVSAGLFHGSSHGLPVTGGAYSPLVGTGIRASFEHSLTDRVRLRATLDADALITTSVFEIDYMETWRSPRVEVSAGIGVLAQFL
jgi:hypothetical protein